MENLFDISQLSSMVTAYAPKVLGAILTLIIGFMIAGWVTGMVKKMLKRNNVDATLVPFLS
ncbi:MAG: mechanosensitive ion channel family protein, partial [Saprospiraceae bacterium]